jgi:VanZ family protein
MFSEIRSPCHAGLPRRISEKVGAASREGGFVFTRYQPLATRYGQRRLAFGVFVATGLLGASLEVLQLLLPNRWADWRDVFWSVSGAFAGALAAYFISGILAPNSKRSAG